MVRIAWLPPGITDENLTLLPRRNLTLGKWFMQVFDGKLLRQDFSKLGNRFTDHAI